MQIIAITAAVVIGALASINYMQYASARSQGRPIPLVFLRLKFVPLWVDLAFFPAWIASACVLSFTLPLCLGLAVYCVAALLPWELMRRHHNRQVKNRAQTSTSDSIGLT